MTRKKRTPAQIVENITLEVDALTNAFGLIKRQDLSAPGVEGEIANLKSALHRMMWSISEIEMED